jgi:hypothetical protein
MTMVRRTTAVSHGDRMNRCQALIRGPESAGASTEMIGLSLSSSMEVRGQYSIAAGKTSEFGPWDREGFTSRNTRKTLRRECRGDARRDNAAGLQLN